MEPLNLLGIRFTLAFAILMLLFGKKAAADIREDRGALGAGVVLGLLYFAVMTLEMNALRLTNAATASFIENSAVVLVPLTEAIHLQGFFDEIGTTGIRDTMIYELYRKEGKLSDNTAEWMQDPYDDGYMKGIRMNLSEKEEFDKSFPEHPLSMARELVTYLCENN